MVVLFYDTDEFMDVYEGRKEYELKIYDNTTDFYEDKDVVIIEDKTKARFFTGIITRVQFFPYLDKLFDSVDYKKFVPSASSVSEAIQHYENTPGFFQKGRDLGIVAFKITRISSIGY